VNFRLHKTKTQGHWQAGISWPEGKNFLVAGGLNGIYHAVTYDNRQGKPDQG
jgi:hypothetical protein